MKFFTILFFLLCLRLTTYTYKREHAYKSPHFPPNLCNLFFDISHFESFHLFPSSTLSVSPHLLLFMNSSIRLRPRSSYPPSLFPSVNHGTLLRAGDVELNPGPSPLNFTHLNIRSIRSFQKSSSLHNYLADHLTEILSLNETWLQPIDSDNFVASLAPPGYSILHSPRLTGQGGGLALIFRSFLKFKLFRTRNLPPPESFELMATKLSTGNKETIFLNIYRPPSSKSLSFLTNSRIYSKFLFHHQWWLQYPFWSNYSWQIFWHPWQFSSYKAHQLSNSRWWSHPWSSHHTIQLYCYHTPFSPWILPVRSQIFHIQILPTHTPYNSTSYHPIPFLQYHWCWQFQKWHPHFPSLHKPSL